MLPVFRIIGHKEWAGPRKSDPVRSMDWRRNRVANFVPRGLTSGPPVIGAIRAAYDRVVFEPATWAFFLGKPRGPEVSTLDKAGRWQEFEKGAILWHPQVDKGNAHVVWGEILKKFWALGAESVLGYPTTDEMATPDTVGRYNHFAGTGDGPQSIYWHPKTGPHVVGGAFRAFWAEQGWETSKLGYPTSGEFKNAEGVTQQNFQGGSLRLESVQTIKVTARPL